MLKLSTTYKQVYDCNNMINAFSYWAKMKVVLKKGFVDLGCALNTIENESGVYYHG